MASALENIIDTGDPPKIFISYSRKDKELKDAILPQLKSLERLGKFSVWHDDDIKAGVDWYARIYDELSKTKVAICLISPDFLSSPFCMDEEIPYLLQARNRGDLEIFPILIQDCVWEEHRWLKRLQIPSADTVPLAKLDKADRNTVLADMTRQIRDFLGGAKGWERPPPTGEPPEKVDIKRLPQTGDLLFGRSKELKFLDDTWNNDTLNVAVFKASGGVGKSSLVRAWVEDMALDNYNGAKRVYAWSFYSQGTKERVTSADEFISHALGWFGDATKGEGLSPWDRGQRLADLVREKRTLLLLDGLEPLQSGQKFDRGKIKDPSLEVLLDELGRSNPGLCLISTREEVTDLWHDRQTCRFEQFDLDTISATAGRALLRVSGIEGEDAALEQAVQDFGQHAYAVKLLGNLLTWSGTPDIKHAADIPDLPSVEDKDGKHPRRVMTAFAERFGDSAKADILAMLGLFDRPANAGCVAALREEPAVSGLNAAVLPINEATWQEHVGKLRKLGLLTPESHHAPDELDAHPLVREHFGAVLRAKRKDAWKAGHKRVYEHLKTVPEKYQPDTLAEMAPLFQAVHHGCHAGWHQTACVDVFFNRLDRGAQSYITAKLGAWGSDLDLVAAFFESPFEKPIGSLSSPVKARILNAAGHCLRGLGRPIDAIVPMQASLMRYLELKAWGYASRVATNLSELLSILGSIAESKAVGTMAVELADQGGINVYREMARCALADVHHQFGQLKESNAIFEEATIIQEKFPKADHSCYNLLGCCYSNLLLTLGNNELALEFASLAHERAKKSNSLQSIALSRLYIGRAKAALGSTHSASKWLIKAIYDLRRAGVIDFLGGGLLARSAFFREMENYKQSRDDLDEAMRLATRCSLRLHECDAHLEYARLEIKEGQRGKAIEHITSAAKLVEDCGYHRRDGEVDALKEELRVLE